MCTYFVDEIGLETNFNPYRPLFRKFNAGHPTGHSVNLFHTKRVSGNEVAVRCNCGGHHPLDGNGVIWGVLLSKQDVEKLKNGL